MEYKIALHGKNFYKEIKLSKDWSKGLLIGTTKECQMRFAKESFATDFVLQVRSQDGQWVMEGDENVSLKKQDGTQERLQYLMPLDKIEVCDKTANYQMFSVEFSIDFVSKTMDYDKIITCKGCPEITVGGMKGCTVQLADPVLAGDFAKIKYENGKWIVDATHARYGILINGFPNRTPQMELKNRDIITINGFSFYWNKEELYTSVETELTTQLLVRKKLWQKNHLQYPRFVRSARQQFVIPEEKVDILPPKTKPEEPKKNLVMTFVPMLVSMGMMMMMRGAMGGNPMFLVMCVGMSAVSIVMGIIGYKNDGAQYKKDIVKRENDYNRYIAEQEQKIQDLRVKETIISAQKFPSIEEELEYVEDFNARLFEKQKSHEDYLFVRLGEGDVPSKCEITFKPQEYREIEDPMMDYPEKLHEKYEYISNMPVTLDMTDLNAVGFLGDRTHLYQMSKNLILQFCIEHYYKDVKLYLLMGREDKQYFEWARWFKNFCEDNGMRNFGYDEQSGKLMLEYLYAQLSAREKLKEPEIKNLTTNIVLIYRSELLGEHPVSNYLDKASKLGFKFLFFEEFVEKLNPYCDKRVFLSANDFTGYIQDIKDGEQVQHFKYTHVPVEKAMQAAMKMACVYVDEVSLEATLTKNITLYQLLGIHNVYDIDLKKRWATSKIYESMAAPLGVKSGDEVVALDLHEKYHGPHGLVAGTTGSGKSEILQSYILSMATLFHPYEVGFIIIDFKGGGMVNQFRDLPHLNGAITNIDGKEIDRSLASIKAEIKKRQRYFAEYDVNHINDYIRLFKEGKTKYPLPHLILIVDEFAELKSDQPEFMKELISAARIGRSLGVHLILATQKPAGVVNDQIWSNSKFKLCLKVQNQSDSNEVLKSPLAAEIREPGRAYLQVGNNEIFQLFQSAYSGAPVPNGALGEQKKFNLAKLELNGARQIIFEQKPTVQKGGATQLDAIVDYVAEYCEKNNIERLPNICLPPLAEFIPYTAEGYNYTGMDVCVPIGMYDDPDNQYQGVMDLNLSQGHTVIIGAAQMGKTNMLQVLIRGIASRYSSSDVQLYLLDFASMVLKNYESLKHVGDVITYTEDEKLKNFFKMMEQELANRKDILSELGLSSYSAYREAGLKELPQIIIMLDNMGVFREMFSNMDDKLLKLVREGSSVGISLVVTAQQTSGMGFKYMSNFSKRFALYCNDTGEYASMFERCRTRLNAVQGRCLLSMDKTIYEGQTYIAFAAEKEIDRVKEIRTFIEQVNSLDEGKGAAKTPIVPEILSISDMKKMLPEPLNPYDIAIGMNYENMDIDSINMLEFQMLGIRGSDEYGRNHFIRYMIDELVSRREEAPVRITVFDDECKEFDPIKAQIDHYRTDGKNIKQFLEDLYAELESRKNKDLTKEPLEYIILNDEKVYDVISADAELLELCKKCMIEYPDNKFSLILTKVPNLNLQFKASDFVKILKDANNLVIFDQLQEIQLFEPNTKMRRKYVKLLKKNEMYFKCGDYFAKYKIPE